MARATDSSLLREVARLYLRLQRSCVAACGDTSSTQCFVLGEVYRAGPIALTELGQRLGLDKSWTSRAVEALAQEGLLAKETAAEDRRAVIVSLTRAGRKRAEELDHTLNEQADQIIGRMPAGQRPAIYESLRLLRDALRAEAGVEPPAKARKADSAG